MHENYGWASFRLLESYTHHSHTATRRAGENVSRLTRVGTRMSTATKIRSSRESRRVLVGVKRAKEIILLGLDRIDALEAAQIGLVNRVVPEGTHIKEALSVAQQLARVDRPLMAETKKAINRAYAIMGLDDALEEGLEIDIGIEGQGMPTKSRFLAITREQGLRAALDWRDKKR